MSHLSTITHAQHLATTFARPCFAKPGESQQSAIGRMRRTVALNPSKAREVRRFPQWVPGMSVREYAYLYFDANPAACGGTVYRGSQSQPSVALATAHLTLSDTPQQLHDDSVTVEYVDPIEIDAAACFDVVRLAKADYIAQRAGI